MATEAAGLTRPTLERPWRAIGPADAPVIVLVHGTALTGATWDAQLAALSDRWRCVAVDLPGHGVQREVPFTLDAAVGTVVRAIEAETARPDPSAVVVGLSLGGYVAMATAGTHPALVRGLVLAGCTREPEGLASAAYELFAWAMETLPFGRIAKVADRITATLARRRYVADALRAIDEARFFPVQGAAAVRALPGRGRRFRRWLEAWGGPTLVINGDLDLVFRSSERAFLRGLPNVRRRVLRMTGHLSNLERPAEFSALVAAFVRTLRTPGAPAAG